jgi:hypothetical protein
MGNCVPESVYGLTLLEEKIFQYFTAGTLGKSIL